MTVTNQPRKGEIYFGVRLYKASKYIGSHDGKRITKNIRWFAKPYLDMFLPELIEKCEMSGVVLKLDKKTF